MVSILPRGSDQIASLCHSLASVIANSNVARIYQPHCLAVWPGPSESDASQRLWGGRPPQVSLHGRDCGTLIGGRSAPTPALKPTASASASTAAERRIGVFILPPC